MSNLATRFIDEVLRHLANKDSINLAKVLSFKHVLYRNAVFSYDAKRYLDQKFYGDSEGWGEVVGYYVLARNELSNGNIFDAFDWLSRSFKSLIDLIKDAKEENWQLPVLFAISVQLRLLAYSCDQRKKQNSAGYSMDKNSLESKAGDGGLGDGDGSQADEYAEKTAECFMICFRNLCTDTRSDLQVSKRWGMMHVVNQLFKIYFKINKINLCNPLKRVIENSGLRDLFPVSHQVVYKFFVGRLAMFENDYNTAASYFEFAFQNCPSSYKKNKKIILAYLIPVNMLRGYMPAQALLDKYELRPFAEIVNAVKQGNIMKFNRDMNTYEEFFIDNGVYLFLEKLRMTTYRNLFKTIARILNTAQIPIDAFVTCLKYLGEEDMDNDICQCILGNLIYENKVKGYISYKHNKLVISKDFKVAFPRLTTINQS